MAAGPWKLYSRWLVDSDKYNEWMNEIDYETEDAAAEQDATVGMSISLADGQRLHISSEGTVLSTEMIGHEQFWQSHTRSTWCASLCEVSRVHDHLAAGRLMASLIQRLSVPLGLKRKVEGILEHPDAKRGRMDALKAAARPAPRASGVSHHMR